MNHYVPRGHAATSQCWLIPHKWSDLMKVYSSLYGFSIIVYNAVGREYEIVGFHNEV